MSAAPEPLLTITAEDLSAFAPKAKPEYVRALLGGLYHLRSAGILESPYRLCHFMAQVGHETDGLTIIRESLTYTSAGRLRTVWPSRFRDKSDAELAGLIRNPEALGDAVYGGRMGNAKIGDGFAYRGGGFLQTTGKDAVHDYAKRLGLKPGPEMLDNPEITLQFACLEWATSKCNQCADENDLTKVAKAINTGSTTSNVKPVGMEGRQAWFAKAWGIWGDRGKPDQPPKPSITVKGVLGKVVAPVVGGAEVVRQVGVPSVPGELTETIGNVKAWRDTTTTVYGAGKEAWGAAAAYPLLAVVLIGAIGGIAFLRWKAR